jgi:signal transduction histidine kinase
MTVGAPPARRRLVRKVLLATVVPAVVVLAIFGGLAHQVARRSLEDELGRRLATAAAGAALLVFPEQITAIGLDDESSATYANLRKRLEQARAQLGVRRVMLVARDLTGRGDTEGVVALGAPAHELGADREELDRAAAGRPSASPLFWGRDGLPYKRGYARVGAPQAVGLVVVEGSASYFASLAAFRRWLLLGGLVGAAVIVLAAMLVSARITGPLARLAAAAERIGRGELGAAVAVETRDELGTLAARLDEMRAALAVRDERLQMMLAGIAHEVRNPLGGLELYAGLLREGLADQPQRLAEVARVEREIHYLKAVVTEFLDYARRPAPHPERIAARPLLEEVAELCAPPAGAPARGPTVTIEVPPVPSDLAALADRGQLRRALVNLARNAVTAAGPGGQVVLSASAAPGARLQWEVRDSGPGVPEALREQIFTPFFTTRERGTGLGLAFARDIARAHGGDLVVDAAPEGGARFRLSTPSADVKS